MPSEYRLNAISSVTTTSFDECSIVVVHEMLVGSLVVTRYEFGTLENGAKVFSFGLAKL